MARRPKRLAALAAISMVLLATAASTAQARWAWNDEYGGYVWEETWAEYCYPWAAYTPDGGYTYTCVEPPDWLWERLGE